MATNDGNIEDLSDDELEAQQRAADGEDANTDPVVNADQPAEATPPADAAADDAKTAPPVDAAAAPAAGAETAVTTEPAKVEGVMSKDGSRVLPYTALQAERRSARAANARAERTEKELASARQLIEDLKAGKTPETGEVTEADVADMEANFPEHGQKMRALFERAKAIPKAASPQAEEPADDPVQEAIDQVPLLLNWQHGDAEKFERARDIDVVLAKSPKWVGKPVVERFAHVARLVADEYDIPIEPAKPSTTAAAPAAATTTAAIEAQRKPPETLSDFKGGSVADHGSADVKNMTPQALLSRMDGMTDAEIDAHLAKYG